MPQDNINLTSYFGGPGKGKGMDLDALFKIFGVKTDYKPTDPAASVYTPQTGTPGPQIDQTALMGSVAPMSGVQSPVEYSSAMPPADGKFWLQDIVNRAHNATMQTGGKKPKRGGGGK